MIEKLPDHDTNLLSSIQHLLLSGLRSRHRSTVNRSILTWNRTFGCTESLSYPKELRDTLLSLQRMTDIHLPNLPVVEMDQVRMVQSIVQDDKRDNVLQAVSSSPIQFIESQNDNSLSHNVPIAGSPESHLRAGWKAPPAIVLSANPNIAQESPLKARHGVNTTPKARLRHNDSQIRFAAIDSSPLAPEQADSQVMTERQKQVKERQGLEAAMFPEIRPSPKSAFRSAEYSLPKLNFKPNHGPILKAVLDEQISPMFPPDILMNDFLGSSPTPASSKKRTNGIESIDGPPSSPPLIAANLEANHHAFASVSHDLQGPSIAKAQDLVPNRSPNEDEADAERRSDTGKDSGAIDESASPNNHLETSLVPTAATNQTGDHITSNDDVIVDAPFEATENVPAILQDNDIDMVNKSVPIGGPSELVSEDDQVTAQLINEMERASSQHINENDEVKKSASKAPSKRKNPFTKDANAQKRARGMPASSDLPQQGQTPAKGQAVAECVMIDVRPAHVQLPARPVEVKRERSKSPSVMANIRPARHPPLSRKKRGRRGKSWPGQLSQEASSLRSSPRQRHATPNDAVTSSLPGSATSVKESRVSETDSGKRKASKFWYYTTDESAKDAGASGKASTSGEDDPAVAARHNGWNKPQISEHQQDLGGQLHTTASDVQDRGLRARTTNQARKASQPEAAADVQSPDDAPTAAGILQGFRRIIGDIKRVTLGREHEREISKLLFQAMEELHEAGRRHTAM